MNDIDIHRKLSAASQAVSEFDTMFHDIPGEDKSWYFKNAIETFTFLNEFFALSKMDLMSFKSVMDYGCGFGRLTRYFVALFGGDKVIACDTSQRAVDFVSTTFGCIGVHAEPPFDQIQITKQVNLIFAGSLFTHIPLPVWHQVLSLFDKCLSEDGYIVMTTAGEHVVRDLQNGGRRFGIDENEVASILLRFEEGGFAFANYPGEQGGRKKQAGRCVASNAWVSRFIERETPFRVKAFFERGWSNRQDIYVLTR